MAFNRLARPRIAGSHGAWVLFAGKPWRGDAAYAPDNRGGIRRLNQALIASYIVAMMYWVFSFAQKEAERREFTPQMQNFLLAVAGVARADRAALTNSAAADRQRRPKP